MPRAHQVAQWMTGLGPECDFWSVFRDQRPRDFAHGMDLTTPLDSDVDAAIAHLPVGAVPVIVDVGCGMMSSMGHVSRSGRKLAKYYVDTLARDFAKIAQAQGFCLPHTIDCWEAEMLSHYSILFGPFDVVYARNSLDHCYDPAKALQEIAASLRTGGSAVLKHYYRCADRNNHSGLHQWNFYDSNGFMYVEGAGCDLPVLTLMHPCVQVAVERYQEGYETLVKAIYRKPPQEAT